jgi:PAS domain S-box-containing protein
VDTVDSLILGLDPCYRVQMWNRCAAETTGWSADEVMGEDACAVLLEPEERGAFDRAVQSAIRGMGTDVSVRIRTKRGDKRIVRWRITPLTPEGSALPLVLAAGTDVTEKLELEARAAEAEALGAMGRLTAGLAHEVRNPLNAAKLQLEIISRTARRLEASDARAAIQGRVEIVNSELGRLSRLLDEFLGLARPQHLAMGPVDLEALVREVVELQAPVADNAGVELRSCVDVTHPARGDAAKLKQALMNLIVNSLEAIGDAGRGEVEVRATHASDGLLQLSVADTGPGLPQSPKQLLQPFVTTKAAGTGLGLTIVNRIVQLHGGTMEIGPRPEGGTLVRIHLPVAKA